MACQHKIFFRKCQALHSNFITNAPTLLFILTIRTWNHLTSFGTSYAKHLFPIPARRKASADPSQPSVAWQWAWQPTWLRISAVSRGPASVGLGQQNRRRREKFPLSPNQRGIEGRNWGWRRKIDKISPPKGLYERTTPPTTKCLQKNLKPFGKLNQA